MNWRTKTVRFSVVVQRCGKPEAVTLWGKPDRQFNATVEKKRVVTVHRQHHGAPDFGELGFHRDKNATYLVFPKSLAKYENSRIVGIRYDLLAEAEARGLSAPKRLEKPTPAPKPAVRRFKVTARVTSTVDVESEVEAPNKTAAKKAARAKIAKQQIDFSVGRLVIKNVRAVPERP